jgi:subtilisin-like proprotein convertase family protein
VILAATLVLELVRHSLTGTHCRYREYVNDVPTETYVTRQCECAKSDDVVEDRQSCLSVFATTAPTGALDPRAGQAGLPVLHQSPETAQPLRITRSGRLVRRVIVEEAPLQPFAYDYDATSGALVQRTPLFFNAQPARIFDPNPVAAIDDPSLQDRNDAASAVPEHAYETVEVDLRGPHARLFDRQSPNIPPPDPDGPLLFNREEDGFEAVNAYFHVDRTQRYLQSLGYTGERGVVPYAIEIDPHAANGADNSFFLPSFTRIGFGALHYGDGGTDDAEDADLVVHEYGHAILEWIAPSTFAGTFASESRALAEGFGDYLAYSRHVARRLASGRDPFCFADWDARCWEDAASERCAYQPGSDCLRRLDSALTMADYDRRESAGVEHRNGTIWSSALREIHQQLGGTIADTILIESFFDTPPHPTFAVAARRLIETDRMLYGAAHAEVICASMTARGILAGCDDRPRGELTLFQSSARGIAIPDNNRDGITSRHTITDPRAIERLLVRVDITHATRGDLRLELAAPDGTLVVLQQTSSELTPDIHTTFGLTTPTEEPLDLLRGRSAAGEWQLIVRDLRTRDAGTLLSWGLLIQFADDAPLATRPRGERAQVIPVVTHLFGAGPTPFATDVRLSNPGLMRRTATLIYTRSGDAGRTSFSAIDAVLEPGQTLAFDDLVTSAFQTAGSGTLEILGDVVVMSRTYATTSRGTMGQQVPANLDSTALNAAPLLVAPFRGTTDRVNLGVTETAGGTGIVRAAGRDFAIAPFSHVQFATGHDTQTVRVLSGDARVVAYLSQIDNATSDPMFIPAQLPRGVRTLIAPAISARGANGTQWATDVWSTGPSLQAEVIAGFTVPVTRSIDVLAGIFPLAALRITTDAVTMSRIRTDGMSQFVPLLERAGPIEQQLLFIETAEPYRTNIGIVSDAPAFAEVVVYDAAGTEVTRTVLSTEGGVAQVQLTRRIVNGRATVRFLGGTGRAYASLVDNRTGDATYVDGQ